MKSPELLDLLVACYRERLAMYLRHQAGAAFVEQYDFNNTYQYVISREETQLSWLASAVAELGGVVPETVEPPPPPNRGDDRMRAVLEDDAQRAQAFVDRWRPRVDAMTHDRHRNMLRVILGETLEHKRFFDQALAGRTDLLGRHPDGAHTRGRVLPTRWIE